MTHLLLALLLLLAPPCWALRPLSCANTECGTALAADLDADPAVRAGEGRGSPSSATISGGSDAPLVPKQAYQSSLRVWATILERGGVAEPRNLGVLVTYLRHYQEDYPIEGAVWAQLLQPYLDDLTLAVRPKDQRRAAKRLRHRIEALMPQEEPC